MSRGVESFDLLPDYGLPRLIAILAIATVVVPPPNVQN
jgi:hypothetical protein